MIPTHHVYNHQKHIIILYTYNLYYQSLSHSSPHSTHRKSYFPLHTLLALSGMQEAEIRSEHYVVWEKSDYKENHACSSPHNIYVRPCPYPIPNALHISLTIYSKRGV